MKNEELKVGDLIKCNNNFWDGAIVQIAYVRANDYLCLIYAPNGHGWKFTHRSEQSDYNLDPVLTAQHDGYWINIDKLSHKVDSW